jgi:hypothetical protein
LLIFFSLLPTGNGKFSFSLRFNLQLSLFWFWEAVAVFYCTLPSLI